jgi:zinc protease
VKTAIREEVERLLRDGVTQDELEKAKQGFLQSRQVGRTTDGALASMLVGQSHAGRTMEYHADGEKKIAALTPDQVLAAVKKHFDPTKLVIVTAGDFEGAAKASQ